MPVGADEIDVACAWEVGRREEVLLTIQDNQDEAYFKFVGLSREEARMLAGDLLSAADSCDELDRTCEEHDAAVEREEKKVKQAEELARAHADPESALLSVDPPEDIPQDDDIPF